MGELLQLRLADLTGTALMGALTLLACGLALPLLSRWLERSAATTPSALSLRTDLGFVLLSPITELVSRTLTSLGIVACALLAGAELGPELLGGFGPVADQPRWLIIAEMLVLGDLLYYWTHRLAHTVPWLWRLHAVHHSTEHLRAISAMRAHPAEAYTQLLHTLPLFALGFPVDALVPLAPIFWLYALLIHSDLDLALRPVSYLFNSPLFHRWHHAREVDGIGTNFAGLFPVYDAIFGTYQLPDHAPDALGIVEPIPASFTGQLLFPFRRPTAPDAVARPATPKPVRTPELAAARRRPSIPLRLPLPVAAHEL